MNIAITFDTLQFTKKLIATGASQNQAEVLAETFKEVYEKNLNSLASKKNLQDHEESTKHTLNDFQKMWKQDVQELRIEMKSEFQSLRHEFDVKLLELKSDVIRWMISIVIAATATQVAIMGLMLKFIH